MKNAKPAIRIPRGKKETSKETQENMKKAKPAVKRTFGKKIVSEDISEKSTKGVRGFLLWNPFDKEFFFRVYNKKNKKKFKDYDICIDDLEIEILTDYASLYHNKITDGRKLAYPSRILGKVPKV